jgi:hypothetical protein
MDTSIHGQSMDPNIWGPCVWSILFFISTKVDLNNNYDSLIRLYNDIKSLLPCSHCRRHYSTYILQLPPNVNIKADKENSAVEWLWTIHDMVNQNLGKYCMNYEKVIKRMKFMTSVISDTDIVDMIVLVWYASKNKEKCIIALKNMMSLIKSIHEFEACRKFDSILCNEIAWNGDMLLHYRNSVCTKFNFKEETLNEFESRIKFAVAV